MRDLLPAETALRDWATAILVKTYEQFGFSRIETPAVENIANLRGGEGGENLKLIFELLKRGEKLDKILAESSINRDELADLGLRFDLTVPLVRFFAQNQAKLPSPFKSIQIGSVWRAESPQQGRYRQFTQCDIDTFGIKSEIAEMELIEATAEALLALGFENFTVRLNDRRILHSMVQHCGFDTERYDNVFIQIDKLDKIGLTGVEKELLAQGHDAIAVDRMIIFLTKALGHSGSVTSGTDPDKTIPNLPAFDSGLLNSPVPGALPANLLPPHVDKEVVSALNNVLTGINKIANGRYSIEFDPTLVRGMGYYTGQIFEISCPGYAHSVAGGGRYDKMVGKMIGRDVPACGFSIGFERIISILMEKESKPKEKLEKIALIFETDRDDLPTVLAAATKLRTDKSRIVSVQPKKKELRKQLDALLAEGYTAFTLFKGDPNNLEIKPLEQVS
jgi:histidyl-tRNA synthetase